MGAGSNPVTILLVLAVLFVFVVVLRRIESKKQKETSMNKPSRIERIKAKCREFKIPMIQAVRELGTSMVVAQATSPSLSVWAA